MSLAPDLAPRAASIVVENLRREYPYAAHHMQESDDDTPMPRELHPAFATSFDWHSCVHMHWLGVRLLGSGYDLGASAASLRALLAEHLTHERLATETVYLQTHPTWERPYGGAWLVRLAAAAASDDTARGWGEALEPAVDAVEELVDGWIEVAEHPVRHGVHSNSAFGLCWLHRGFVDRGREMAAQRCVEAARAWFFDDRDWPADWEMSGQDFLSPGLAEADLMARVLGASEFADWLAGFLPELRPGSRIVQPYGVTDPSDGQLAHLDGLNLTRAGALVRIADVLETAGAPTRADAARASAAPLLRAGLAALEKPSYLSTHWLASFAWDALESGAAAS